MNPVNTTKFYIKKIVPRKIKNSINRWHKSRQWHAKWNKAIKDLIPKEHSQPIRSLVIFPADPRAIFGSLGDDAMITGIIEHYRSISPELRVSMFCMSGETEKIVSAEGFHPIPIPKMENFPADVSSLISNGKYDAFIAVGADVMDGYYSAEYTKQILFTADLSARLGMQTTILGFSFNEKPAPELAACYTRLDKRVALCLRDPISLKRIKKFAPVNAKLVADAAFTLNPGQVDSETKAWIAGEKVAGNLVIGINLHPMLIRNADFQQVQNMVTHVATAIINISKNSPISWILIPHDYRDKHGDGDGICLRPLMKLLEENKNIRFRYFEGKHRAATLKALVGHLDGIFSGRMHLAIAALGMGVPVLCLTYQDKFAGLFQHFRIPEKFLLSTDVFKSKSDLTNALNEFIEDIPDLNIQIQKKLPYVKEIASLNFDY